MTGPTRSGVPGRHGAGAGGADVDARFVDLVVPPCRGWPSRCGRKPDPARCAVDDRARQRGPP
jgi:hypothetical protein